MKVTHSNKEILSWTEEDVRNIAENSGLKLSPEQLDRAVELSTEQLNESDFLNDTITSIIEAAINEAREEDNEHS